MDKKEAKEILNDPKKLLDVFRLFHQLLHVYDAQEIKKQFLPRMPSAQETMGLQDSVEIKVIPPNKTEKEVQ